jgi:hypothetical protein
MSTPKQAPKRRKRRKLLRRLSKERSNPRTKRETRERKPRMISRVGKAFKAEATRKRRSNGCSG